MMGKTLLEISIKNKSEEGVTITGSNLQEAKRRGLTEIEDLLKVRGIHDVIKKPR